MQPLMNLFKVFYILMISFIASAYEQRSIHLRMPDVRPTHDESYLCTAHRLNLRQSEYIVGFQPEASAKKVHHILIYGCTAPGIFMKDTPNLVWECGEMSLVDNLSAKGITPYDAGPVCKTGEKSTILFGWALDAPAIELPPKVGFRVGGNSSIDYLVLQVHYGDTAIFREHDMITDNSGIILETVRGPDHGITKQAGIYLLVSWGYVPAGLSKHQMECTIQDDRVIHPFRFRTHTHKLGTKVGAYKKPAKDPDAMILIGEHNPQEPQMFYPVEDKSLTITQGDRIYAYCDFNNTRERTVNIGSTGNDEMCNFYMMYWVEGYDLLKNRDCLVYNPI